MFKKALFIAMLVPSLTAAAAAPGPVVPQTMQLSSWQSQGANGVIASGTQSVTITNTSTTTAHGVEYQLEPPPCECRLESASTSDGAVLGNVWSAGDLLVGATATLELVYAATE